MALNLYSLAPEAACNLLDGVPLQRLEAPTAVDVLRICLICCRNRGFQSGTLGKNVQAPVEAKVFSPTSEIHILFNRRGMHPAGLEPATL